MGHALVTGGSRGIGLALAAELARRGTRVTVTGRDGPSLDAAIRPLRARGLPVEALVLDAGDAERAVARIRALDEEGDGLDLVVANAGVGMPDPAMTPYAWEAIRDAFHVNFCGAAATLTAALPAMVARGRGHLVAIGSLASFGALPRAAAYCAPKAGLSRLLECLELDLAGTGVAVTDVRLGFVRTRMVARATYPLPSLMEPDDVAKAIADALPKRPRALTLPRGLALATRAFATLPLGLRAVIASRVRPS